MTFQTYNLGLPVASNNPSVDQPNMQTNNDSIPALIAQDHYGFGNNAGGNHKQVHLLNESAPGGIIVGKADGVFYANTGAGGASWPYWQNALGSFQMMGQQNIAGPGYLTLPGGLIIQWGTVNGSNGANNHFNQGDTGTVTFSSANIAFPTACFGVQMTCLFNTSTGLKPSGTANADYDQNTLSKTKFDWSFNTNSTQYTQFFWIAIGN